MVRVIVTEEDIAAGIGGNCHRSPVAIAMARDTGDSEANVHEQDWMLRVEVWGRSMLAPYKVRKFVREFDALPRTEDGRLDDSNKDFVMPKPFKFELPEIQHPDWEERCYRCEELFDPSELDDEGTCEECRLPEDR
jgi:hypothetical protein